MHDRNRIARPLLERLEARCVPALLTWLGAVSDDWSDGNNWSLGLVPDANDDVVIVGGANAPAITSGSFEVRSILGTGPLTVSGGRLDVQSASSLSSVIITGGTLDFDAKATLGSVTLSGGKLEADGLDVYGTFDWSGGTLKGDGLGNLYGQTTLSGGDKELDRLTLRNHGTMTWSGGDVDEAGGGTFENKGQLTVTASAAFDPDFTNTGSAVINTSGTAAFGAVANTGTVTLDGGRFDVSSYTQTAGTLALSGGTLAGSFKFLLGGTMTGGGTVEGSLTNSGAIIILGQGQTLTVTNDYKQSGTGVLRVFVNTAGADGRLVVGDRATLGGTLDLRVSGPAVNSQTTVVSAGSRSGEFGGVNLSLPSGATGSVAYAAKTVSVAVAPSAPAPTPKPPQAPVVPSTPATPATPTVETSGGTTVTNTTSGATDDVSGGVASALTPLSAASTARVLTGATAPVSAAVPGAVQQAPVDVGAVLVAAPAGGRNLTGDWGVAVEQAREAAEAILASVVPVFPEVDLPESASELRGIQLGGQARKRLSHQGGASLSPVATVQTEDDGPSVQQELADRAFSGLLDPAGRLGVWDGPDAEAVSEWTPEEADEEPSALASFWGAAAPPALLTVAALAAAAGVYSRPGRHRRQAGGRSTAVGIRPSGG